MKKSFVVRIDEEMYKKLEAWAHDEFRSVNGQIEYLINQSLIKAGRQKIVENESLSKGEKPINKNEEE